MNNTCCFFGHRDISDPISDLVYEKICDLIENKNISTFIVGDYGHFDKICASMVRKAKKSYKHIRLILIRPYFSNELNTNREYYEDLYDDIIIPDELADVHYKSAIGKRNEWMIENSQYGIFFVKRQNGGAYNALKYAEKLNKKYINLYTYTTE